MINLPLDILFEFMNNLNYTSIIKFSRTSTKLHSLYIENMRSLLQNYLLKTTYFKIDKYDLHKLMFLCRVVSNKNMISIGDNYALILKNNNLHKYQYTNMASSLLLDDYNTIQVVSQLKRSFILTRQGEIHALTNPLSYKLRVARQISVFGHLTLILANFGKVYITNTHRGFDIIPKLENVIQISSNKSYALFLTSRGQVYSLRQNIKNTIKLIPHIDNIISISTGSDHSLALTNNGDVHLLKIGYNRPTYTLLLISSMDVISISSGQSYFLVLTSTGNLYAYKLEFKDRVYICKVAINLHDVIYISAGPCYSFAMTGNDNIYMLKFNRRGTLENEYKPHLHYSAITL